MNSPYKQKTLGKSGQGFTIIEVVLVLAIAALIFLMVFIALPALQRGQRDSQRKSDLSRISAQITSYETNNKGAIPTTTGSGPTLGTFVTKYLAGSSTTVTGSEYSDPSSGPYTLKEAPTTVGVGGVVSISGTPAIGTIYYKDKAICGSDGAIDISAGGGATARNFAMQVVLEGQQVPYCLDNK